MAAVHIYTDGGSRGNPGISGYGLVVYDDENHVIYQESKFLGVKTNNEAEYLALIGALTWARGYCRDHSIAKLNFYSDSQLLVRQVQGIYKIKAANLQPLFTTVKSLLSDIQLPFYFKDVRRELNTMADKLANEAMDRRA